MATEAFGQLRARTNDALEAYLQEAGLASLDAPVRHLLEGGKRLRPILAMLACQACGQPPRRVERAGVALELLHTFTLIHDDVMDGDTRRRNLPTVHIQYGTNTAILAGDALHALATRAAATIEGDDGFMAAMLAQLALDLAEGQQLDLQQENHATTLPAYLEMIRLKTASFTKTATSMGAHLANAHPDTIDLLAEAGEQLGLAFQIRDDHLNLSGKTTGKTPYGDVRRGKMTLPAIHATNLLNPTEAGVFQALYLKPNKSPDQIESLVDTIKGCGALEATQRDAQRYADNATTLILATPAHTKRAREARQHLIELAQHAATRDA